MQKRRVCVYTIFILIFGISGCTQNTEDTFDVEAESAEAESVETEDTEGMGTEDAESESEGTDTVAEKQAHILEISNGQCLFEKIGEAEYEITLYDKEYKKVDSMTYSYREPSVEAITESVLEINYSVGSPARYTYYFNMETAEISDTFFNSILFGDKYIAYMAHDDNEITLILIDIFKKEILYQEIRRDFSRFADYMGAVISIEMIDEQNIQLKYYAGEEMTIMSEIIALEMEKEVESISQLNITGQTKEEAELIGKILSESEEELQSFLVEDWEYPHIQWWIEVSGFDFTGDGREEIIVSKCDVNQNQTISYNYVYDRDGNKLLEFIGGNLSGTYIIRGWDGDGTFLLYNCNNYAAHLTANIFTEIRWENGKLEDRVKLIEYDTRDSRQVMEGKEGYYILKDLTKEEEQKLWYGVDGMAELHKSKEYVWEDENLGEYKQLFYTEDKTEVSTKGVVLYNRRDGLFIWDKYAEYTVEERTISEQDGEWTMQISYPYVSRGFSSSACADVNQSIEEEIRDRCETYGNTVSYEIDYEIKYRGSDCISILFYGRRIPVNGEPESDIAWASSYFVSSGRHMYVVDVIHMSELQDKLDNGEFEQVRGNSLDSYDESAGETDWFQNYSDCLLNDRDKEHQCDFYLTDKKIGILIGVPHAERDYVTVEIDYIWGFEVWSWEDWLSAQG